MLVNWKLVNPQVQFKDLIDFRTSRDSSVILTGNLVSAILGIVFTIFAARFLGPSDWGIVAAVGNMIPILIAVADIGLGSAVFGYTSRRWNTQQEDARKFYLSVFTFRFLTILFLSFVLYLFGDSFANLVYGRAENLLAIFTILGFFVVCLLDFQVFSIEARQRWITAAIFISLTNVLRVCGLFYLFSTDQLNLVNVLLVFVGAALLPLLLTFLFLPVGISFSWKKNFAKLASFSAWMGGNKLVSALASRVDILFLIQLLGAYDAGIYGAASRLAMGVPLIIGSIATVIASRFASLGASQVRSYYYKTLGLSLLVAVGLVVGIFVAPFITQLFGPEYSRSKEVLQWLFVGLIPFALSSPPVNLLIYHFKKPGIITTLSVVQLLIILGVNWFLIPVMGILAPVLAIGLGNTITMFVSYFFAWRSLR